MRTIRDRWAIPLLLGLSLGLAARPSAAQPRKPAASAPAPPIKAAAAPTAAQKAADAEGLKIVRAAGDLDHQGKYAEAIALAEKALAIREKALGKDASSTITTVSFLAEIWEHKKEFARAVPLRERVLAAREKERGPTSIEAAFALEDVARDAWRSGDFDRAITLYQRALAIHEARSPKGMVVAMTLTQIGRTLLDKRDPDGAETAFLRAITAYEGEGGSMRYAIATVRSYLAAAYEEKRQYLKAEEQLTLALHSYFADEPQSAPIHTLLGILYFEMGQYVAAEPHLATALRFAELSSHPGSLELAPELDNLAEVSVALGDYPRAEGLYLRALEPLEKSAPPYDLDLAETRLGLGKLHLRIGDVRGAEPLVEAAIAAMQKNPDKARAHVADALGARAEIRFRKGDPAGAEAELTLALAADAARLGQDDPKIAEYQSSLGRYAEAGGKVADAERLFQKALSLREKVLGKDHPTTISSLRDIGALKLHQGNFAEADPLYQRALAGAEKTLGKDHLDVAAALSALAAIDLARGNAAAAIAKDARAVDVEEHNLGLILQIGSEAQKQSFMKSLAASTDFTVSLHLRSAPKDAAAERLSLLAILQRKGRVLDVMADTLAIERRRLPEPDRPLVAQLAVARGAYAAAMLHGAGAAPFEVHRENLSRLSAEIQSIEAQMSAHSASFVAQETPATIERVQAAIPEDATLLEYFVYRPLTAGPSEPPRLAAYTLRPSGKIRSIDLGPMAAVEAAVTRLHRSLAASTSTDTRALGRAVDELVMHPVRDLLDGATRVLVAPDGALNLVPFAALVDEEGRYLVDRFDFTYLTSGRDVLRQELQTAARARPMVFANPAFGRPSPQPPSADPRSRRSGSLHDAVFPALPGTASEARALSQILPDPEVLVDTAATETALKKASGPRLLHIATHGFFLPDQDRVTPASGGDGRGVVAEGADIGAVENPLLRSGLVFAGANGLKSGEDDGILTALEASGLDLDGTDLVVLSACETGLGDVLNGDGVYGIRRALFLAGAKTQVTSLWKVDDKATRDLMVEYYDKLLHGGGRSASLREVQREMLAKKGTEHPYFWATFVVSGDPSPLRIPKVTAPEVPKVPPSPKGCGCEVGTGSDCWGSVGMLVGILAGIARRRRER